jgi:glycerol-3-phosphate O-acyltransferase
MWLGKQFGRADIPAGLYDELRALSGRGAIVFVMRSAGWLNLSFIRWLVRRLALPAVGAAVGLGAFWRLLLAGRGTAAALRAAVAARAPALVFLRRPSVFHAKGIGAERGQDDPFAVLVRSQASLPHPIFLVPILYIWSRRPQRLKPSLIDIVLGSPEAPGIMATSVAFLRNYHRAFVRMGRPIDLADFLAAGGPLIARKVRGALYYHLSREARAVVGPPFKGPARVRDEVLRDRGLQEVIAAEARELGRPEAELTRRAARNVHEIAARMSPMFMEIIRPVAAWICDRLYDGIELDEAGLAEVRQAANQGGLVLCPSHKSHMDYVLLSWLFYDNGILPPHVAAGINLAFWPFAPIARWSGAFFIRRSVKGDRLYTAVLRAYVKRLMRDGFPQEFFIEGGRSRTGKLAAPKTGLLAMEVDAWRESTIEDLFFVPIAIDYEKLPEGKSYARELSGGEKRKESFGALLRARKILRSRHGRIYVQFERPISLRALAAERPTGEGDGPRRAFVQSLANRIAYGINRASTITPVGLCAVALLAGPGTISGAQLAARIALLRAIATRDGGRISSSLADASTEPTQAGPIGEAMARLIRDGLAIARGDGAAAAGYQVPRQRRAELDFYRNNVIHHFIAHAIVAATRAVERDTRWLSRLLKLEFIYRVGARFETIFAETVASMEALDLRAAVAAAAADGAPPPPPPDGVSFLAQMVRPYLDAYRSAAETLIVWPGGDRRAFVKSALERARQDCAANRALPESVSKATLDNAAAWLTAEGALEPVAPDGDRLRVAPRWRTAAAAALISDIDRFRA